MKTAISIPADVFKQADQLAKRLKMSRSQLYSEAVAAYVAERAPEVILAEYNRLADEVDTRLHPAVRENNRRMFSKPEWSVDQW